MNYWHLQMSLPHGRGGIHIDTMEMLTEDQPVIGTGEWDHYQCTDFKNELNSESIVCVRDGGKVMALCKVISNSFQDKNLQKKYYNENYRYVEILEFYRGNQKFPQPQGTLSRSIDVRTPTYKFIDGWYKSYLNSKNMNDK